MTSEPGFWDRLGLDEAGMPKHLPMGVTAEGQGPTNDAEAHHFVCWCGLSDCPLTKALAQAHQQAAVEGWEVVGAHDDLAALRDEVARHFRRRMMGADADHYEERHRLMGIDPMCCNDAICRRAVEEADALLPLLARIDREARIGEREQIVNAVNALRPDAALPSPVAYRVCQRDMLNLLRDRADSIASEVTE